MNLASISSANSPILMSNLQPASPTSGSDQDGDGGGASRVRHGHGGGHMSSAIAQALQSLGFTLPAGGTTPTSSTSSPSTNSTDATGTSDASKVKGDLSQFMHQLFEAVKSEDSAATSSGSNGASSPGDQSSFATGLSALISQVSSGTGPAALQSAFAQLSSDLSPASVTTSSSTTGSSSQATLQAFLTNLQQDLGYGQSNASVSGNLLTTQV